MPTYEYRCPRCGHEYEKMQKISDSTNAKCPECGARGKRLISSGGGIVFKGSGFYETDYKRKSAPSSESGEKKTADTKKTESPKKDT